MQSLKNGLLSKQYFYVCVNLIGACTQLSENFVTMTTEYTKSLHINKGRTLPGGYR